MATEKDEVSLLLSIDNKMNKVLKDIEVQGDKTFGKLDKEAKQSKKSVGSLSSTLGVMGGVIGAIGVIKFGSDILKLGASAERTRKTFGLLAKSQEKGNALFDELNELANNTPLDNFDLYPIAQSLQAFGSDLNNITPELEMLGNLALGDAEKMGRLADAFGKVQTKGKASLEELNRFAEAGVPIFDALAEQLDVTKSEVFDLVSSGVVGFDDLKESLESLTAEGAQFNDIMSEISGTAEGKFSTAMGKTKLLMADIGETALPAASAGLDEFNHLIQIASDTMEHGLIDAWRLGNLENDRFELQLAKSNASINEMIGVQTIVQAGAINVADAVAIQRMEWELLSRQIDITGKDISTALTEIAPQSGSKMKGVIPKEKKDKKSNDPYLEALELDIALGEALREDSQSVQLDSLADWEDEQSQLMKEKAIERNELLAKLNYEASISNLDLLKEEKEKELEFLDKFGLEKFETEKYYNDLIAEQRRQDAEKEQKIQLARRDTAFDTASALIRASQSAIAENKKAGNALKIMALAEIAINTSRGIMNAWAAGNYIENIIETAGIVSIAGIQTGVVASQSFSNGGHVMPEVGVNSYSGDNITAKVNADEEILTASDPRNSKNGGGVGGQTVIIQGDVYGFDDFNQKVQDANNANEMNKIPLGVGV